MTERRIAVVAALVAAAALVEGCAAGLAANRKSPGTMKDGAFTPTRPPAANYGPDPALTCPSRGVYDAIDSDVRSGAGAKAPRPDGRLCAMADTLLGWPGGDKEPPPEAVRAFLSQYFGLPSTVRSFLIQVLETDKEADIASALAAPIVSFGASARAPLYGVVTEYVKKGQTRVIAVMYDQSVVLDPLPRQLAPGATAPLSGKLVGAKAAKLQIVDPVGKLEKVAGQGEAFRTELRCGDKPGRILVQISGEGEGGGEVNAATFPVACGTALATSAKAPAATAGPVDPAQAEKQIGELLNQERTSAGLKALQVNEALSKIARDISQKRAQGQGISSADLTNQLKEADIASPLVLESAAMSFGPDEVYARLSESPQDRANAMRPDISDVGVGVAKGADVGGRPTIIATELFVTQLPPPNAGDLKQKLYTAIARKRSDARKNAVAKDPTLESVAQKYADAAVAAGGDVPRAQQSTILAPLYKGSMTVNQMGGFVPNEETALSLAEQPSVVGDARLVGVGVAVGRSPQFGKNSPFVIVLMGTRHGAAKAPAKK
jgi:uncharacterized protein YkwD